MIPASVPVKQEKAFVGIMAGIMLMVWAAIYFKLYYLALVPFGIAFVYLSAIDFKWVYYFLIVSLPLSTEFHFSDSLGTDIPDEALMLGLTILGLGMLALQARKLNRVFFAQPLIILLFTNLIWMAICTVFAEYTIVSLKVLLAKIWYIVPFVLLTATLVQTERRIKIWYWCLTTPLSFTVLYTLVRHGMERFEFDAANHAMEPFFRNHVNYAEMLCMVLPFTWLARSWYRQGTWARRMSSFYSYLYLVGILFSYTRLAWLSVPIAIAFALALRMNKLVLLYSAMLCVLVSFFVYMGYHNHYLYHAPDFATTIQHHNLDAHLAATYGVKDVSNAERLYRWVAGVRMVGDRPITGYGPGNFYFTYKPYTVRSFTTYVSDNEEHSTVHNYYLLTLIEQGIGGLLIFLALITTMLVTGQRLYNRLPDGFQKSFTMAVMTCFMLILFNITANDMIETDKVGSLFFMCMAFVVNLSLGLKGKAPGAIRMGH